MSPSHFWNVLTIKSDFKQLLAAENLTLAYWSNSRAASECRRCSVSFPKRQQNKPVWDLPAMTQEVDYPASPANLSSYMLPWLPARSLASRASWSGGRGICCATQMAFLQLGLLANACRALAGSPHRQSNRPACSACCCSTRRSA